MATKQQSDTILPSVPPAAPNTPILSAHDVVQQAAAAHAAILAPYMSSDSDDDIPASNANPASATVSALPVASSSTCNLPNQPSSAHSNPAINAKITSNGNSSSSHELPQMEPICESTNDNSPVLEKQPTQSDNSSKREDAQAPVDAVKMEDQVVSGRDAQPGTTDAIISDDGVSKTPDGDGDNDNASANNNNNSAIKSENGLDPAASTDTINVSRSCLDGVVEQLASRISELENIRERKKARVERLSSAAMMAQNATTTTWPQSAALAAAQAAVAANNPATINPIGPINSLSAAAAAMGSNNPPPPIPVPSDGGERKQSRYWTADEHERFLAALKTCGPKNYVRIAELVGTRNAKQVRTHAQKFQKKLEREEAKRQEDIRRHGGAASSVSAAAVAAVAAAAAAMHHNGHLSAADAAAAPVLGAYAVQHPHLFLPYNHPTMAARTNSLLAMYANAQAAQNHQQTPSTNPHTHLSAIATIPTPNPVMVSQPQAQQSMPNQIHVQSHTPASVPPVHNVVPVAVDGTSSPQPAIEPPVAPETVAAAVAAEVAALGRSVYSGKSSTATTVPVVTPPAVAVGGASESNEPAMGILDAENREASGESKGKSSKQGD